MSDKRQRARVQGSWARQPNPSKPTGESMIVGDLSLQYINIHRGVQFCLYGKPIFMSSGSSEAPFIFIFLCC